MKRTATLLITSLTLLLVGNVGAIGDPTLDETNDETSEAIWHVDLASVRQAIDGGSPVQLPVGDLGHYAVYVVPMDVFAPGQKKVERMDGTEEPLAYWAYVGPGALLSIDDRGMYGHVDAYGKRYNLYPVDEENVVEDGEFADVRISWDDDVVVPDPGLTTTTSQSGYRQAYCNRNEAAYRNGDMNADQRAFYKDHCSTDFSSGGGGGSAQPTPEVAYVKPHADLRYRNAHSNYATRIANAFQEQAVMWYEDTNIKMYLKKVKDAPNYSGSSDCDTHLRDFRDGHPHSSSSIDAWQLFTGKELSTDSIGCAFRASDGVMVAKYKRDSVVEAVDHRWWDSYDPDERDDLGLVSGHEIGHNWGEPDHPNNKRSGMYNIMATDVDPDQQDFWFTSGSASKIKTATRGNF